MKTKNSFFSDERLRRNRYFSEEFKKLRVKELENNLVSVTEICKSYNVSRTSVYRWIYKFSVMSQKQTRQVVEAKSEARKLKLMEERIKELERLVGQKQIQLEFTEKMIEIAEETYDIDIKKKLSSKLSAGSDNSKGKNTSTP